MQSIKVSIVMSVFNGESNVESTITSVLNQTYKEFEFIIINDKSTDNTMNILEDFSKKDNRISIIKNNINLGLSKSLVKGVKQSKGNYIARIDSGDLMMKDRIKQQLLVLEDDVEEKIGLVATNCLVNHILSGKKTVTKRSLPHTSSKIKKKMTFTNCIPHVSVMFRKDIYEKVGGYDGTLSTSQDFDLWIKMLSISDVYSIQEYLTEIIYDDATPSISIHKNKEQRKNGIKIIKKGIKEDAIPKCSGAISLIYKYLLLYTPANFLSLLRKQKRKLYYSK